MTLLKPSIQLRRVNIVKDDRVVFDAEFHSGINIIAGHNSSGKTTILDFIAFGLGAENIPWKQEALLCDWTLIELALNETPVTLRRHVSEASMSPMLIYWGALVAAGAAALTEWETYPFKRSSSKISFTQALLLALGLPDAQGDGSSNLTMHQFLRVIYADQPSLHSPIFRHDTFDSALTRETVGNYLCGIYDDDLYSTQLEKREIDKTLLQVEAELRSIYKVLGKSGQAPVAEFLAEHEKQLEAEGTLVANELAAMRGRRVLSTPQASGPSDDSTLRQELNAAKQAFTQAQDALIRLELDAEDSRAFIREVMARLKALDESASARAYFSSLAFDYCPCCLSSVVTPTAPDICPLCKGHLADSSGDAQLLRMRNELRLQLEESEKLLAAKAREVGELTAKIPSQKRTLRQLEIRYQSAAKTWSTELEEAVESLSRREGEIAEALRSTSDQKRLADAINSLRGERDAFRERLVYIESRIELLSSSQELRKRQVSLEIDTTLGRLLRKDFYRQEEFRNADNVQFSFTDNQVSVEGSTQFSESSTVVLRHLFHTALLSASTRLTEMRFPRFLMLDGIEDGGMELPRAHRLQEIIVEECNSLTSDYQIVFATSQIAPILDRPEYLVGRLFTEDKRSLSFGW